MLVQRPRDSSSRYRDADGSWKACGVNGSDTDGEAVCRRGKENDEGAAVPPPGGDDEEHLPAGQHLLVDIKNVDGSFLDDEERLAQAMVDLCKETGLTLLSYHCHGLEPMGVSCAGVLLESHVSFHTWPEEGVITLDLFTCGSGLLVPVLPLVLRLFGVAQEESDEGEDVVLPTVLWAHKLRGFRSKRNYLAKDMGRDIYSVLDYDMKEEVATTQTNFQNIHVYDVINPRFRDIATFHKSLQNDTSYESLHPELFRPDRIVYLDGVMQSSALGDEAYHEGLVHPGMFSHPNPKRVAIIGGGEGATLREVLKHKTVEEVVMIEIDEMMVHFSREHLPSWNWCGDLVGSMESCFDDARARIYYEDALKWFIDRFYDDTNVDESLKFDVIIMDALDPQDNVAFADALYKNGVFLKSLFNSLSDDGVILLQLGESPAPLDPAEEFTIDNNRNAIIELLDAIGMKSMHIYEEFHSNFLGPWTHLVACKSIACDLNWYENQAQIELNIHKRILRTHSHTSPLKYFDGATMGAYQTPHKVFENVYCRKIPVPPECTLMQNKKYFKNVPITAFEIRKTEEDGRMGVFTTVDIPKGATVGVESVGTLVHIPEKTFDTLSDLREFVPTAKGLKTIETYLESYSDEIEDMGVDNKKEYYIDTSILTFMKHDSKNNNIGHVTEYTSQKKKNQLSQITSTFSPLVSRNRDFLFNGFDVTLRDVIAGEEILTDDDS